MTSHYATPIGIQANKAVGKRKPTRMTLREANSLTPFSAFWLGMIAQADELGLPHPNFGEAQDLWKVVTQQ
jgi:hypothetical protein